MKNLLTLQRSLLAVTISLSLFGFATALVGVFIPLIILQSGAPLWVVAGFYVIYAMTKLALNYPSVLIIQRFGAHFGLGAGFIIGALQMAAVLLYARTHSPTLLIFGAASLALTNAFLWNSQHVHISRVMNSATKSSSMATISIIDQVLGVAAPLIGGFVGLTFGPQWLLAVAVLIALAALIPLRKMGELDQEHNQAQPRITYNLRGAPVRDLWANFCFNIDTSIGNMVWPIYLAVAIGTFKGIGLIAALAAAVTVVVVWLAGHRGDRGHDRSVLRQGITVSSLTHVLRFFAQTTPMIALVSTSYRASLAYMGNAWTSTYYHHAKARGIPYVMSMEIMCDLAYAALWSVLFVLSLLVSSHLLFWIAFTIAAVTCWGCLLISKQGQFESNAG